MNFEGIAIKCNSDEEVQEIYKMAVAEGLLTHPVPTGDRVAGKPLYFRCGPTGFHDESGKDRVVEFQDFIAAHKKPNPFENMAVKCNTFDEIQELAKIAEGMGLKVVNKNYFNNLFYFRYNQDCQYYSSWSADGDLPVIPYADFIASLQTADPVNRPSHYTSGKIEVIDFIEDQQLGYHLGNVVKYVARAGKKDPAKEVQDLEKARWHLAFG